MVNLSQRQEAIITLLAQPDPADLKTSKGAGRFHAWRWRSPRDRETMKQDLLVRWMVRREIESVADAP